MGEGLLALVGVGRDDGEEQATELARKLVHLRIFAGQSGWMDRFRCSTPTARSVWSRSSP
jgi:D-Tyr-tRNAtyr deacylase